MRRRAFIAGALLLLAFLAEAERAAAQDFITLKGHGGPVMALDVSPDGQVATASFDNSAALWEGRTPERLEAHDAAVTAIAFLGGGRLATGGDDFAVILWEAGQPKVLGHQKGKVTALALSPDGAVLAAASWDGSIGLWPLSGGAARFLDAGSGVNDLAYARDGRLFAATMGGGILVFPPKQDAPPRKLAAQGFGINQLVLGEGDAWLAYGAVDGATRVIDAAGGAEIADFTLDRRPVLALAYHAGSGQLAAGDGHGFIMVADTQAWRITRDFRATREGPVWALAFSPDGKTIWAGGLDEVAYGWPVEALERFEPGLGTPQSFLRPPDTMPNGERQFMRKCSICHALEPGGARKAGPSLHGLFGRAAGSLPGYRYSETLAQSDIIWSEETIDALFGLGPDHFIPGSKMPMQQISGAGDRQDLIRFLKRATNAEK